MCASRVLIIAHPVMTLIPVVIVVATVTGAVESTVVVAECVVMGRKEEQNELATL